MKITNVLLPKASRTMKRIVFLSVLVIVGFTSYSPKAYSQGSNTVSVETAKAVAINYCLNTDSKYAWATETDLILSLVETKTVDNTILYYVFNINKEDGFIIISANRNIPPVLCYGDKGYFDLDPTKRPPAFNDWLGYFTNQIEYSIKNVTKNTICQDLWNSYVSKGKLDYDQMKIKLNSIWNQTAYFNKGFPETGKNGHPPYDFIFGGRTRPDVSLQPWGKLCITINGL